MQRLCIGVNKADEDILQYINNELRNLSSRNVGYEVKKVGSGDSASIICSIDEETSSDVKAMVPFEMLKNYVSNGLADYIIKKYEYKMLERIINTNYCYFNSAEKKEIMANALKIINNNENSFVNSLFQIRRRNIIISKLLEYFDSTDVIILDGFVNFRLKEYKKGLEEIVDKAVDDFLMEREYKEFIRLLKYFVEIQEPKFNAIHIIVSADDKYMLFDDEKREITNECIADFISEIAEDELNYDDLLVSSLITLAPRKIVIHNPAEFRNKELLETIKNVFCGKVIICNGCDICLAGLVGRKRK